MPPPQQPPAAKGAKSGLKPGAGATPPQKDGGKRPVREEDVFGGAERTRKNEGVKSKKAKP
jgi:hypothetical protein